MGIFNVPELNIDNFKNCEIKLKIGKEIGESLEESLMKSKKFIYIISPYISPVSNNKTNLYYLKNKKNYLKNNNIEIDIKILTQANINEADENDSSILLDMLREISTIVQIKDIEKIGKLNLENETIEIENNKNRKWIKWIHNFKNILKISVLIFLIHIIYYSYIVFKEKLLFDFIKMPEYLAKISILTIIFFLILILNKNIKNREKKIQDNIKEMQNNNVEISKAWNYDRVELSFNFKVIDKTKIFPHLKLFIMDYKENFVKIFFGSANFTFSGFSKNIELLTEITGEKDDENIKKILNFFNNLYNSENIMLDITSFIKYNFLNFNFFNKEEFFRKERDNFLFYSKYEIK